MTAFPRMDPLHPLTRAARSVNAYAANNGIESTIDWLGINAAPGQVMYLGEQRAIRALAAASGMGDIDSHPDPQKAARGLSQTPIWRDMRLLLISCEVDGMSIGWKARAIAMEPK